MNAGTNNGKRAYICHPGPGFDGCGRLAVIAEPVEEIVVEAVLYRLDTPALAREVRKQQGAKHQDGADEIATLEARMNELAELWAAGEMTRAEWTSARKVLSERLTAARSRTTDAAISSAIAPYMREAGLLRRAWPRLANEQRR
jgi:hypothetical protein